MQLISVLALSCSLRLLHYQVDWYLCPCGRVWFLKGKEAENNLKKKLKYLFPGLLSLNVDLENGLVSMF